jgi:hypothetical protein
VHLGTVGVLVRVALLLAGAWLALVAGGCGGSESESEDAGSARSTAETTRHFKGVLPKPRFATPGKAAYCSDRETSQEELGPTLFCWTPSDGFGVAIAC